MALVVCSNLVVGYYMSRWHQSGPIQVMSYLATEATNTKAIHFWTPCHATPYYSVLHHPVPMWFPDCSPNARLSAPGSESEQLQSDPLQFVHRKYASNGAEGEAQGLPSHVVLFTSVEPLVSPFLERHHFVEDARYCTSILSLNLV